MSSPFVAGNQIQYLPSTSLFTLLLLGLNMYGFSPSASHLSHHSNLPSHETASTNNNTHHHNNNNHRDASIDKESSLGESCR